MPPLVLPEKINSKFKKLALNKRLSLFFGVLLVLVFMGLVTTQQLISKDQVNRLLVSQNQVLTANLETVSLQLSQTQTELEAVKAEDQFQRNEKLQLEIKEIETAYGKSVEEYEKILDLRGDGAKVGPVESQFALILSQLSKLEYEAATASLKKLQTDIQALRTQLASLEPVVPPSVTTSNAPPASGHSQQAVETEVGRFLVDILSADLGSTKVVVETASAQDCANDCPVASLGEFVSRAGGYAGINGPYFCPAEYPSCAGKTNSFDTSESNISTREQHWLTSYYGVNSSISTPV